MKQITWVKRTRCSDSVQCSDDFVNAIEQNLGILLKPKIQNGDHNGWLDIVHDQNSHTLTAHFYETSDPTKHILRTNTIPGIRDLENVF